MADEVLVGGKKNGLVSVRSDENVPLVEMIAHQDEAIIGAGNKFRPARITLYNSMAKPTFNFTAADAQLSLGGNQTNGGITLRGHDAEPAIELLPKSNATIINAGLKGRGARLTLHNHNGDPGIELDTSSGAGIFAGSDAKVSVRGDDGSPRVELLALGFESVIGAGRAGAPGRLSMFNNDDGESIRIAADDASVIVGDGQRRGTVSVRAEDGTPVVELLALPSESVIGAGNIGRPGRMSIFDGNGGLAISLEGASCDILLANADCAEEFDTAEDVAPGMVVVLDDDGGVVPATRAYDPRVAGVVSGAGAYRPGLVLDRRKSAARRMPVALMGKVFCLVDATRREVRVGDLLTTSATTGHAMRATDRRRSFGSVLGKALAPLAGGCALIPVLVALR